MSGRKEFTEKQNAIKRTLSSLVSLNKPSFGRDLLFLRNKSFLESLWGKIVEGENDVEAFVFDQEFPEAVVLVEYITNCNLSHLHHLLSVQDGVEPFRPYEDYDIADERAVQKSPRERVPTKSSRMTPAQIAKLLREIELPLE